MRIKYSEEVCAALPDEICKSLGIETRWHERSGDFDAVEQKVSADDAQKLIASADAAVTFDTINAAASFHPNRGEWEKDDVDRPQADTSKLLTSCGDADDAKQKRRSRTLTL